MGNIFKIEADTKRGVKLDARRAPQEPTDISHVEMVEKPCLSCGRPRRVSVGVKYPYCNRICAWADHGSKVFKRGVDVGKLVEENP